MIDGTDGGQAPTLPAAWVKRWRNEPGATVLVDPSGAVVTAAMLLDWSAGAARRLSAAGVRRGERVVLSAGPSIDLVVAYVALLRLGAVVVPANTSYTGPERAHVVHDASPMLAVADDESAWAEHGLRAIPPDVPGRDDGGVVLDQADPDDLAWLCYTSGTTGRAKGAMLTHANLLAGARAVVEAWRWSPSDRLILALPLFHMHGLGVGINGALLAGSSAVVLPRFDVDAVLDARREFSGTMFFGVPTMYARLAESPRLAELSEFRLCVSGSAPMAPNLWCRIREGAGVEVLERYGMTETVMLCSNPIDGPRVPGVVGRALPDVELRLAADGGVEVRGPSVFAGYFNQSVATSEAFTDDGWFRTGDVGAWTPEGLALIGRTSELIITGGYNVYPREVEDAVRVHPSVSDVAVVGLPDPFWGERVEAYLVAPPGLSQDEQPPDADLDAVVADRLAPYKRPKRWTWVEELPRNAMGKVQRDRLDTGSGGEVGG